MATLRDQEYVSLFMEKDESDHDLDEEDKHPVLPDERARRGVSYKRSIATVAILAFMNILIYLNRYSLVVMTPNIQSAFKLQDSTYSVVNAVLGGGCGIVAPFFGFLGDRCTKKCILCVGIVFWSCMTLCMSFIPNEHFLLFLLSIAFLGAGEASFCTIAPSIIADLFGADKWRQMLTIFHMMRPVGWGLGYIVGPQITSAAGGDWHWAFRVTPGLGLIASLLLCLVVKERPRATNQNTECLCSNNWMSDIRTLFKNPSFMCATFGATAAHFLFTAIGACAPSFLKHARIVLQEKEPCIGKECNYDIGLVFGPLKALSGILGVVAGVKICERYGKAYPRVDPNVCAYGMLFSIPFLILALMFGHINLQATYAFMFIEETFLAMNLAVVADIVLSVVSPRKRSTALAMHMKVTTILGHAWTPYLIYLIAEQIREGESPLQIHQSLQHSLISCAVIGVIGAIFFFATAFFIEKDRKKAEEESEE